MTMQRDWNHYRMQTQKVSSNYNKDMFPLITILILLDNVKDFTKLPYSYDNQHSFFIYNVSQKEAAN